jgi:outer membrane protein assembly factor BamB
MCGVAPARPAAGADPIRLIGESQRTVQRLAEAADLEGRGRWTEAVELYLRLLDEAGDDLVPSDADNRHYLPARGVVHRRLAARADLLPPYRDRVEVRAQRLLELGESQHDPMPLEQLVANFFCSRSAESALHLLGDFACERGEFEQARRYWRLLEPATSPNELALPDPKGDVALPRAKQVLARLLAGERDEAAATLRTYRADNPNAVGHLAGRRGNLADTLQQLLETPDLSRVPAAEAVANPTTFAGDATRNGLLTGLLPPFSPQPRYPPILLPGANPASDARLIQRPLIRPAALAIHPVIAQGQVFVADASRVTAYDLATGQLSGQFDITHSVPQLGSLRDLRLPSTLDADFTVTLADGRVFARLGPPKMRTDRGEAGSYIACLQWRSGGETPVERLQLKWLLPAAKADAGSGPVTAFEGTPAVRDRQLFVAVTRIDGNRAITALACYDADDPTSGGPLWQQDVYETGAPAVERARQHLVTLAGSNVIYCSHAGAVVALDAATGRRAWAVRYPTRGPRTAGGEPSPRDLAPCIAAADRIYAAPADSDRLICLDAATGAPLWQSDAIEVAQLLGVAHGRLVGTFGGYLSGLFALDAATGRRIADWGYRVAGADGFAPFGRGLLCADRVYWPTRGTGVQELRWDGTLVYAPTAFQSLPGGNVAYGDGCLVVATADRLHVLVGASVGATGRPVRIGQRLPVAADDLQNGLALADSGRVPAALDQVRTGEPPDGPSDHASRFRHELLLWQADRLRLSGRPADEVRAAYLAAATTEFDADHRLAALARAGGEIDRDVQGRSLVDAAGMLVPGPTAAPVARRAAVTAAPSGPSWRPPLEQVWSVKLDPGESVLTPGDLTSPVIRDSLTDRGGMVVTAIGSLLRCRTVPDGVLAWERKSLGVPEWLSVDPVSVTVAGRGGIGRYARRDGQRIWEWRAPVNAPWLHPTSGWRDPDVLAAPAELSDVRFVGSRLFARLGERSLISLDGISGALMWQRQATPASRLYPEYAADDAAAIIQTSNGQCWAFDASTGRTMYAASAATEPWPQPPVPIGDGLIAVSEDDRVVAFRSQDGRPVWNYSLPRWPSLAGQVPRIRRRGESLIVGVGRNEGFEVISLDRTTGAPRAEPIVIDGDLPDLNAVAVDDQGWCVAAGHRLRTLAKDGRLVEDRELPAAANWRVDQPHPDWWLLWTAACVSTTEPPVREGHLVLLPRRAIGGPVQSLRFEQFGPRGRVWPVREGVVVVTAADVRFYRGVEREAK